MRPKKSRESQRSICGRWFENNTVYPRRLQQNLHSPINKFWITKSTVNSCVSVFFWWSSYHHGNTLILPWYFHHGKNHRNTRSNFLIFFSENYFISPIKNIIEGYFFCGCTMVLPWYCHGSSIAYNLYVIS